MSANALRYVSDKLPLSWQRIFFNFWPPFLAMGIKIEKWSPDSRYLEASMKLHWYNTNYVGVHFGGGIYALTDAFYMLMLMKCLGRDYIVWDKAASINFQKPGTGTLRAIFTYTPEEIQNIREQADANQQYIFNKPVEIINEQNIVVALVTKTLYVRRKDKTKAMVT